jgi:hypothetical protein
MLLDGTRRDAEGLRRRVTDKELARVVRKVAEARSDAASSMEVPAEVAKAHPHLLLSLAALERAAESVLDGSLEGALDRLSAVRREEAIFRAALRESGHDLPSPSAARALVVDECTT